MPLATSLLCLSSFLPVPQGDLRLPPRTPAVAPAEVPRPLDEVERFRRDLDVLASSPSRTELLLQEIGLDYPVIEPLILEVARRARAKEMTSLMLVARRFGRRAVAEELRFQLLARPLGAATRPVVDAMVYLMGPERDPKGELDEKSALRDCIRGQVSTVCRPATEALAELATDDDLEFAVALSSDQSLDLKLRGIDLLRAIASDQAKARLVKLLSKEPAVAGWACSALSQLGEAGIPALQELLSGPPIDRGYCYAAFALAEIGDQLGRPLLAAEHQQKLEPRLESGESLTRCLAALALADLAYYGTVTDSGSGDGALDVAIGDALLDVVDSRVFVPNLDLMRGPAERRLVRMTGRIVGGGEAMSWREWWQLRRQGFVGIRSAVAVDEGNAADAVVTLQTERRVVRLLSEGLIAAKPQPDRLEIVLRKEQMLALVRGLESCGFGDAEAMRCDSALPRVRLLELQVGGARAQVSMPATAHMAFDSLVARIEKEVDRELWQLYRHPENEPDRAALWRSEQRWLDAHADATERGRRFGRRVFANWGVLTPWLRGRALEHLFARADRGQLFDESDGDRIVAIVRDADELQELELHLLELAAGVPGDRTWRECIDVAARATGGGRAAVRSVFAVLGPESVLAALDDQRAVVRRVAVEEAVLSKDMRAAARLVAMLQDGAEDEEVRRVAAYACGQLRLAAARVPLVDLIAAEATAPLLRRECLRALGRAGGEQAFTVLDQALYAPVPEDREAAINGLGELRDLRAAHRLAEIAVIANGKDLGRLALFYLGRLGASLAVPALRHQVKVVTDPAIRTDLVLLLGGYQDPESIPDLMELLRTPEHSSAAAAALSGTTGFDLLPREDRWLAMDEWWRANRSKPQWTWLLDALAAGDVPTVLRPEHFEVAAGREAIPELARLLSDVAEPRLFVLTSAVLRDIAKEDFGVVTLQMPAEARAGIASKYRLLFETQKAAQGK
ncbi:MAG: HEAT repeat domain-containing protein [Planctomycetes bacterium]|nr:HEAT repeat domain-containing protein [Planctomycetota bacterium]